MSNTINWGKIHGLSYSPETNLTGTAAAPSFTNTKSIELDGIDDVCITSGTYSELNGLTQMSFSAWIKPTASSTSIISSIKDTLGYEQLSIMRHSSGYLIAKIYGGATNRRTLTASPNIAPLNTWSHIAFTLDLSQSAGSRGDWYINGVNVTSSDSTNQSVINTSGGELQIGKRDVGSSSFYTGLIDEVAIWKNITLTSVEVVNIYNSGAPNDLNNNGLTAPTTWYRMGDGDTAPTIQDKNGSANLSMTNFSTFSTDVPT